MFILFTFFILINKKVAISTVITTFVFKYKYYLFNFLFVTYIANAIPETITIGINKFIVVSIPVFMLIITFAFDSLFFKLISL